MNIMNSSASHPSILCVNILQYIFHSFFSTEQEGFGRSSRPDKDGVVHSEHFGV